MGKRYGRNQRRRHREQIANLTEAYTREVALLRSLRRELDALRYDLQRWDEDIVRLLGRYSAFRREPPVVDVTNPMRYVPIHVNRNSRVVDRGDVIATETNMAERMHGYFAVIRQDVANRAKLMRVIERDRGGVASYAVSVSLLAHGLTPTDVMRMAQNLAEAWAAAEKRA